MAMQGATGGRMGQVAASAPVKAKVPNVSAKVKVKKPAQKPQPVGGVISGFV